MQKTYCRLSKKEREEISIALGRGESSASIARRLERHRSTISREINRFVGVWSGYRAWSAEDRARYRAASRRAGKRKMVMCRPLGLYVQKKLRLRWSPEEISKRLVCTYPTDSTMRISPEAIYQYLYVLPRGTLKDELVAGLRKERKFRHRRRSKSEEKRGKISNMLSIEERPKDIADRVVPGHWEGDLVVGKRGKTAIGTLVERTTRYTIVVPLKGRDAHTVRQAFAKEIRTVPKELRKSLTYDQGKEMQQHERFRLQTGIVVYFAHPHSPWERGTNENTNGLLRQYFPKGTDFSTITTKQLKRAQRELNGRPRKILQFATPEEKFTQLVALKC